MIREVLLPLGVVLAALVAISIYPSIAFFRGPYRRYRRRKKGLCLTCGYDLTGNESGTCPECGMTTAGPGRDPES